jgi:7-cyano-7-deazaguanine synthase
MGRSENCVVLLSGGLDSTVMLYWVKERYDKVYPLYVNYGSSHREKEYAAALKTCEEFNLTLETVKLEGNILSGSSLVDSAVSTPSDLKDTINTVVPFRNIIMLSLAASYADKVNAGVIATSPTKEDFEVFRDCRRIFHDQLEVVLRTAAKFDQPYQILTPFINNTKDEVIAIGVGLDVDFSKTWTCYSPKNDKPCGVCPSCQVREKGFKLAGIPDPLITEK